MQGGARHPSKEAFLAGDGLRAYASTCVLIFHATYGAALHDGYNPRVVGDTSTVLNGAFGWFDHLFSLMPLGVYVFFSLSGYLLSRRFILAYVDGKPSPRIGTFLKNRVLRIVPAFWFAIALVWIRFGLHDSSVAEALAVPLMLQLYVESPASGAIEHAWTIDTEWALYLGLPAMAWLVPRVTRERLSRNGRIAVVFAGLGTLCVASLTLRGLGPVDTDYQRGFWAIGWSFLPGIALAAVEVVWAGRWRDAVWGPRLAYGLMAAWLVAVVAWEQVDEAALGRRAALAALASFLVLAAPLLLQWTSGRSFRTLDNRPARWLGERSYSLYLMHTFVGYHVVRAFGTDEARRDLVFTLPLVFGLSVLAAALVYRYVESPFLQRKTPQSPAAGAPGAEGVAGDRLAQRAISST